MCSSVLLMANPIQRLPVIEWQPDPAAVRHTYARTVVASKQSDTTDFGFIVSMVAVLAVCFSGLTIAATTSVNTDPTPQTYIHRSN